MTRIVVHNHLPARDVSPEQINSVLQAARTRFQDLHYRTKQAEAEARKAKREGNTELAARLWDGAIKLSSATSSARSDYNAMVDKAKAMGINTYNKISSGGTR